MGVIIIGAGDVGFYLAKRLIKEKKDVLVIEKDERKVRRLTDEVNCKAINASGSDPRVLKEAGIEKAEMLIAVTNSDEVNIAACMIAGMLTNVPTKICRSCFKLSSSSNGIPKSLHLPVILAPISRTF